MTEQTIGEDFVTIIESLQDELKQLRAEIAFIAAQLRMANSGAQTGSEFERLDLISSRYLNDRFNFEDLPEPA